MKVFRRSLRYFRPILQEWAKIIFVKTVLIERGRLQFWDGNTLVADIDAEWSDLLNLPRAAGDGGLVPALKALPDVKLEESPEGKCWFCRKGPRWCAICFECEQKLRLFEGRHYPKTGEMDPRVVCNIPGHQSFGLPGCSLCESGIGPKSTPRWLKVWAEVLLFHPQYVVVLVLASVLVGLIVGKVLNR